MKMQQVELMSWSPCSSPYDCCERWDDVLHWRQGLSRGLQRLSPHWRGNHVCMTFYIFSVLPCHSCILTLWNVWVFFFFPPQSGGFAPSKCNSDWVVVGGHLKWTPQRPCLGNEIAFALAFLSRSSTVHVNDQWHVAQPSAAGFTQSNQTPCTFTIIICYLSLPRLFSY